MSNDFNRFSCNKKFCLLQCVPTPTSLALKYIISYFHDIIATAQFTLYLIHINTPIVNKAIISQIERHGKALKGLLEHYFK